MTMGLRIRAAVMRCARGSYLQEGRPGVGGDVCEVSHRSSCDGPDLRAARGQHLAELLRNRSLPRNEARDLRALAHNATIDDVHVKSIS